MADFGFYVYDDQGNLQADDTMMLYYVRKTGTATTVVGIGLSTDLIIPTGGAYPNALYGFSGPAGYKVAWDLNGAYSGGNQRFISNAPAGITFNYYIIDISGNITPAPSGAYVCEAYDELGRVTFTDQQWVAPTCNIIASGGDWVSYPGRTLAGVPLAFGGHNRYGDPMGGEPGWYWHDYAAYGVGMDAGNTIMQSGDIIIEQQDVFGSRPPDSNQFERPNNFFVMDVTGIPIGQTFY